MADPRYPYGGGGGGHKGTGPIPIFMRITPEELTRACGLIRTSRYTIESALTQSCKATWTHRSVCRAKAAGRDIADRINDGELDENDLTERDAAALRFFDAISRADSVAEHILIREAHADDHVVIARDPDSRDANGAIVRGKEHVANPRGAGTAQWRLSCRPNFRPPKQEIEHSGTVQNITTYADDAQKVWEMLSKDDE